MNSRELRLGFKTVITFASRKLSNPLHSYTCVHSSKLHQPHLIMAMMHRMLAVTTVIATVIYIYL